MSEEQRSGEREKERKRRRDGQKGEGRIDGNKSTTKSTNN